MPSSIAIDPFRIDRTIRRVSAKAMVAKDALEETLQPLLRAAGVACGEARLDGSAIGKSFTLRALSGGRRAPEETLRAVLDVRRLPSGEWRSLAVKAPVGSSVAVFTDPDRSSKQRRIGWHISSVTRILRDKRPDAEFAPAKAAGAVAARWEPLVRFDYNADTGAVDIN